MMTEDFNKRFGRKTGLAIGGAVLMLVGVGGGAGAMALTRHSVEMAPTLATPIARLADTRGIVTVKGQVEAVYGDRVLLRDGSGQTLVDVGPRVGAALQANAPLTAQGRYDNGQLHARFLVAADGTVEEVGPPPHPHRPGGLPPHGLGADGPPPPPSGALPPPPVGDVAPAAPGQAPAPPAASTQG